VSETYVIIARISPPRHPNHTITSKTETSQIIHREVDNLQPNKGKFKQLLTQCHTCGEAYAASSSSSHVVKHLCIT
jgi:hypothetical protein